MASKFQQKTAPQEAGSSGPDGPIRPFYLPEMMAQGWVRLHRCEKQLASQWVERGAGSKAWLVLGPTCAASVAPGVHFHLPRFLGPRPVVDTSRPLDTQPSRCAAMWTRSPGSTEADPVTLPPRHSLRGPHPPWPISQAIGRMTAYPWDWGSAVLSRPLLHDSGLPGTDCPL